ncbi:uncharacterized protein LOC143578622 [Bidens hawaiensis]|uniref:uncharacterized protein LOC143578622 n=1 Tax=Bidens hawaiensis TaxID=980011 RepID=UPI00404B9829
MLHLSLLHFALTLCFLPNLYYSHPELRVLMNIKASLDPENKHLTSWIEFGNPCDGSFLGVACNEYFKVVNISLPGRGLTGRVPKSISRLKRLSGLYLHYNSLTGEIPKEISGLTKLSDLYLDNNNITGEIPLEIGNMSNLQVVELCYNQLTGQIPGTLGGLAMLQRLDLSFNQLSGPIPLNIANLPQLEFFDVQHNALAGFVPTGMPIFIFNIFFNLNIFTFSFNIVDLKRLNNGFRYNNNDHLCGIPFPTLKPCNNQLEPLNLPKSANVPPHCNQTHCTNPSNLKHIVIVAAIVTVTSALTITACVIIFKIFIHRRQKHKIWSKPETPKHELTSQESSPKTNDPVCAWDPSQNSPKACGFCGVCVEFQSDSLQSFNVEEIESATSYFSDNNLLGKSKFSAVYKGVLRDRSVVAIKSISVTSCKADETEFTKGLTLLTSLKHENLTRLRGFCCSKSRSEYYLVYDYASNGNLSEYLDVECETRTTHVLDWPKRVSIINGIAEGLAYLHRNDPENPAMIHRNISVEKILLDRQCNPLITNAGLLKLLTDDIMYSALKVSAALGYMAPEYITTGKFTEKSDVYAFGVVVLQILSGKSNVTGVRSAAKERRFGDFIDENLEGMFLEYEADKLIEIGLICVDEVPENRLTMADVIRELSSFV